MSGMVNSAGGFLGLTSGPTSPAQNTNNVDAGLQDEALFNTQGQNASALNNYANGTGTIDDVLNQPGLSGAQKFAAQNALATGPMTGSKFATDQVQNNGILGSLFGSGGQLEGAESRLNDLQNQGFELKPEDMTLYGQTSGNIARMFGAQGNQISQDLANRGLASAPSGAAGAMFSGLNGNQNEMLAQAQQGIMQQRFQNTMSQIGQQQKFVDSLGTQAGNDINQQYVRQLSGAQNQTGTMGKAADAQTTQNNAANGANLAANNFQVDNTPGNFMDMGIANLQGGSAAKAGAAGKNQGQSADTSGMAGLAAMAGG